jgi:fructosamine-3-kinase
MYNQSIIHDFLFQSNLISRNNEIVSFISVHGGDTNQSFRIETSDGDFFIKLNLIENLDDMMTYEADGLKALSVVSDWVPQVLWHGSNNNYQALILPWMGSTSFTPSHWRDAGEKLALQHQLSNEYFGWSSNNYIATVPQLNTYTNSWIEFYGTCRLTPLFKAAFDQGFFTLTDLVSLDNLLKRLDTIYPVEKPALLHGDLWSGNIIALSNSSTTNVVDPSVYYGHREMDIAMTTLFGGFDTSFYDSYQQVFPLESNWNERLQYSQLYPLLVHVLLFGGSYVNSVKQVLNRFR